MVVMGPLYPLHSVDVGAEHIKRQAFEGDQADDHRNESDGHFRRASNPIRGPRAE